MQLGDFPSLNSTSGAYPVRFGNVPSNVGVPVQFYNPPVGSDWYIILSAWDGVPYSALPAGTLVGNGGLDVSGWRANCGAATEVGSGGYDSRTYPGDSVDASYSYPYALMSISNQALTQNIIPDANGGLVGNTSGGKGLNAFAEIVVAALAVMSGAIVGAAVAGAAGVAAAGSGAVVDTGTAVVDTGAAVIPTTADIMPVVDTAAVVDTGAVIPTVTDTAAVVDTSAVSSDALLSQLNDLTVQTIATNSAAIADSNAAFDSLIAASNAGYAAIDQAAVDAATASSLAAFDPATLPLAGGASSALPSASGVGSALSSAVGNLQAPGVGSLLSAINAVNSAAHAVAAANNPNGANGTASGQWAATSSGSTGVLFAAAALAFLLLRKN